VSFFADTVSALLAPRAAIRFAPAASAPGSVGMGTAVAWAGDADGDRLGEFVIGAPFFDGLAFADVGYASVVRGRADWESGLPFLSLPGAPPAPTNTLLLSADIVGAPSRYALRSEVPLALVGFSVAGAGDVNGDGRADLVVGLPGFGAAGWSLAGAAALLTGTATFPSGNATTSALGSRGSLLAGAQAAGDQAGFAVAGVGDANGDGFADVLVGRPFADPAGRHSAGAATLVMGMPGATLDTAAGGVVSHHFLGAAAADNLGLAVAGAGDLNGDGLADFVLAAPNADPLGRGAAGSVYVVFGRTGGWPGDVDLATPGDWGFRVDGAQAGSRLGSAVAMAGDVNGDGFGDLLLGAPTEADAAANPTGAVYLLFGSAGLAASGHLDLATAASGRWVALRGGAEGEAGLSLFDSAGAALAGGGGDVNGDGFADFAVGAPAAGGGRGSAFVVFGRGGPWSDLALRDMTADQGERVDGAGATGGFGSALAVNGDGNADGRSDLLVGAPFQTEGGNRPGEAWLLFAEGAPNAPVTLRGTTLADSLGGGGGNDNVAGFGGPDILVGRGGHDTLAGGDGNDSLFGEDGNDVLQGGAGDNLLDGGAGRDLASHAEFSLALTVNLGTGFAVTRPIAFGLDRLVAIEDWAGGAGDDVAFGSNLANMLAGGGGADALFGLAGDDTLFGDGGDDRLQGGAGADSLVGGAGSDIYHITELSDSVHELAADAGEDYALVGVNNWTLGAHIETVTLVDAAFRLTGSGAGDKIGGNANLANSLDGAGGDDQLFGAAGFADTLRGGAGDDVLRGLGGGDTLVGGAGADQMVGAEGAADVFLFDASGWAPAPSAVAPGGRAGDEIFGFVRGEDVIRFLPASGVTALASLAVTPFAYGSLEGGVLVERTNVVITAAGGATITLYGLLGNTTLTAADFLFG